MTLTPAVEVNARRASAGTPKLFLALSGLAGFAAFLSEQTFERYMEIAGRAPTGTWTASLLGFAAGALAAAGWLRRGCNPHPLRAFGWLQLALGLLAVVFAYSFPHGMALLAWPLLAFPGALLAGASFPLIAYTLPERWAAAYGANLAGALAASVAAPLFGLRGAMWICCAVGAAIWAIAQYLPGPSAGAHPR